MTNKVMGLYTRDWDYMIVSYDWIGHHVILIIKYQAEEITIHLFR
jgi:hypothetical protein